jgi:hypothetical protein
MLNPFALAVNPLGLFLALLARFVERTTARPRPVPDPLGRQGAAVPTSAAR